MAALAEFHTPELFTLIYAERPSPSDALVCLNGPSVHNSEQEALLTLWSYVQNRIIAACKEEFVESAFDLGVDLFQFTPDDDAPVTEDEFDAILSSIAGESLQSSVDWYFEFMNDELCECFYTIDKHLLTERKVDRGVMVVAGYTVKATGDEDGHLTLAVSHSDGSQVQALDMDLGFDDPWAERFSTALIESRYSDSIQSKERSDGR